MMPLLENALIRFAQLEILGLPDNVRGFLIGGRLYGSQYAAEKALSVRVPEKFVLRYR